MTMLANPRRTTTATPTPLTANGRTAFHGLAYDAFDALATAEFWAAALRVRVAPGASPQRAELEDDAAAGLPRLVFRQVTDARALMTPLHLQLTTDDLDGEARRLQGLGARRLASVTDHGQRWMTLADPEGNAFDLVAA